MTGNAVKVDPLIERTFGWLRERGFAGAGDAPSNLVLGATFSTDRVVIRVSYEWRDRYADVTIARRWTGPQRAPYWAQVHVHELVERAGRERIWNKMPGGWSEKKGIQQVFARGAALLREVARDQLDGNNLSSSTT